MCSTIGQSIKKEKRCIRTKSAEEFPAVFFASKCVLSAALPVEKRSFSFISWMKNRGACKRRRMHQENLERGYGDEEAQVNEALASRKVAKSCEWNWNRKTRSSMYIIQFESRVCPSSVDDVVALLENLGDEEQDDHAKILPSSPPETFDATWL